MAFAHNLSSVRRFILLCLLAVLFLVSASFAAEQSLFKGAEIVPGDAIILFDGKNLSAWRQADSDQPAEWKIVNGYMEVRGGNICTRQEFGDCQLHIEFWLPLMADAQGQARSNSGVYLQGLYEIQVLDSYGLKSQSGDCGAIYGIAVPLVNACRPPEQWQTYDVFFHAPRFDEKGNKISDARMSVMHNGIWIHDNQTVHSATTAAMRNRDVKTPGPLMLQDHGNAVRYRNIWIRPLQDGK